jgi:hypothetical protein
MQYIVFEFSTQICSFIRWIFSGPWVSLFLDTFLSCGISGSRDGIFLKIIYRISCLFSYPKSSAYRIIFIQYQLIVNQ